jgi:CubicO group peptidase (beta-lactamase class C family)
MTRDDQPPPHHHLAGTARNSPASPAPGAATPDAGHPVGLPEHATGRDALLGPPADIPARAAQMIGRAIQHAGSPGLSIAVTRHDRLLYAGGFGHADLAAGTPAQPDTAYLWFSMSKIATATAALALADAGRLDLNAPIDHYLAGDLLPRWHGRRPRVRNLLNHTAGFGNPPPIRWVHPATASPPDPEQFVRRRLRHARPWHPIGGHAHYSNLGYLLLGQVLAAATGQPITDLITDTVLRPAGMTRTGYTWPSDRPMATGYLRLPRLTGPALQLALRLALPHGIVGPRHDVYQSFRPFLVDGPGYGGLVGDVLDAARLAALHLGDGTIDGTRIISVHAAHRMRAITTPGRPFDLGLGWFRPAAVRGHNPGYVEHLGSGGGYNNAIRIYPDLDLGIAIMTNGTKAVDHETICATIASPAT